MIMQNFVDRIIASFSPIDYETDDSRDGCTVRTFHSNSGRYVVDFAEGFAQAGWMQFDTDQDAPYFGVWVNPQFLLTLTYCEGDWSLVECYEKERYNRSIKRMRDFYGEGSRAKTIDAHGNVTVHRQDREQFYAR